MKKLSEKEMRSVNGGAWYTTQATCEGFDNNVHNWHSVIITGKGSTDKLMKKDFNKNLAEHTSKPYYQNFSHSVKPFII